MVIDNIGGMVCVNVRSIGTVLSVGGSIVFPKVNATFTHLGVVIFHA